MKKILVPTDFSDCARAAENIGLKIATKANAEIHFLHSMFTPVDWVKLPIEKEKLFPETKARIGRSKGKLDELKKRAEKLGLKSEIFLAFDRGKEEINQHINQHDYDFVVMGSHGARGFKEMLGSNAQKVVRYSSAPVLIVKKEIENFEINNIVFASSFEEDVHEAFQKVLEFSNLMGAQVHLLYVNVPTHFVETDEAQENMKAFLKKYPDANCTLNIFGALNEERGIQKFAKSIKADIIAMTTHGRTGFMKLILPSITESLVNHSNIPILTSNIHKK